MTSKGASIVINYTSASSATLANELLESLQGELSVNALAVQADMGIPTGPSRLVAEAKHYFSTIAQTSFLIGILVNNAGIVINQAVPNITVSAFEQSFNINVLGPLLLVQAALPYLPYDHSGRIINLRSISSMHGFATQSVYEATKASIDALTRTWA